MKHVRCGSIATVSLLALATCLGCQESLNVCQITEQDCQQKSTLTC